MDHDAAISVDGLTRRFDGVLALDDLSFHVRTGEVFGLLGHNGAGKTTTLRLLNGVLRPTSGSVRIHGLDPTVDGAQVRVRTGVVTESLSLDRPLTPREILTFTGQLSSVDRVELADRIDGLLARFGLADVADRPSSGLSAGMQQRVAIARALVHEPSILLLDEPTSRLDPVAAYQVRELIAELSGARGRTVVLCTHNLSEAQHLCDRVVILREGRHVAGGTPDQLGRELAEMGGVTIEVAVEHLRSASSTLADRDVVIEANRLQILDATDGDIPDLVRRLVRAEVDVFAVRPSTGTLEQAYLALHRDKGPA